ncbi:RNA polymerase sigma factor [Paenibacillus sonchi]|uniref:RNA polymerase sigma factor n=1 Tax=Paenibacillus sonchi TaxID=373687 RepID=UPI0002D741DD|nr:sigma-70 family RNA polymerase sigma factor [Paenibacillus sonchi]
MELGWEIELQDLAHAAAMSEEQLRQIMGFYGNDVWHYIYYLTKSADIADDLAQEVFIKCFYRIGTYRGPSSFKAWLFTIARNTVFSYRKSRFFRSGFWGGVQAIRNNEPARNSWPDELPGTARSAEMEYLGNRRTDEIWSIIMQLPDKFREVLVLDLKAELSVQEIAGLTGLSPGTVKSRLHRARHKVQEKLRGMES